MAIRSKVKDVTGNLWKMKLARCNPFDPDDIDIEVAKQHTMPNSEIVYDKFRGQPIDCMDTLTLQNWADGDSGKGKYPHLEIKCLMVYAQKFGIDEWRQEGFTDNEIMDELIKIGFESADYHNEIESI